MRLITQSHEPCQKKQLFEGFDLSWLVLMGQSSRSLLKLLFQAKLHPLTILTATKRAARQLISKRSDPAAWRAASTSGEALVPIVGVSNGSPSCHVFLVDVCKNYKNLELHYRENMRKPHNVWFWTNKNMLLTQMNPPK